MARSSATSKSVDGLPTVNSYHAVAAAYNLVSANQQLSPPVQLAAAAILIKVFSVHLGITLSELMSAAESMIYDLKNTQYYTPSAELAALESYTKGEL